MRQILVSAYACEPFKGSEQGVGWNWVLEMAKANYIHVITRSNNQESIEANVPMEIRNNVKFFYYDTHPLIKGMKKKAKGLHFYYFCWQLGIISLIQKLKVDNDYDYSIHLTMGSIWMPTFLPFFNIPFIWGPVGGGEGIPKSFLRIIPLQNRMVQSLRYLLKPLVYINPLVMIPAFRASAIIARTNNTKDFIPSFFQKKTQVFLETSMESNISNIARKELNLNKKVKLVITGRLVPFKNVITVVKALNNISNTNDFFLTIIGSGPEKITIEKLVAKSDLQNKIQIIEETTRQEVLKILAESDIYLFPSLREGGSWALMEAMAIGLPVVCLKWSGMEIITDDKCAIRLPVTNPEQMPKDMAIAITQLINNPKLREEMGEAGKNRIKKVFNWESKGIFMEELFEKLDKSAV